MYVAVGENETIVSSTDGETWTVQTGPTDSWCDYQDVIWGNDEFMIVGDYGTIMNSKDGFIWIHPLEQTPLTMMATDIYSVKWTGSEYLAVGDSVFSSPDGLSWAQHSGIGLGTAPINDITWSGSVYSAVDDHGYIYNSTDLDTWTDRGQFSTFWLNGITWDGTRFLVVGGGATCESSDGTNWTKRDMPITSGTLYDILWTGSMYIAVGSSVGVYTSTDFVNWAVHSTGATDIYTSEGFNSIAWNGGSQYVIVGESYYGGPIRVYP